MTYPYDVNDWMVDWSSVLEATETVSIAAAPQHFREVFLSRYPSEREARWRCSRVLAALNYLEVNKETLERAGWVLASRTGGTVGREVAFALCGFFGQVSDEEIKDPISPDDFIYVLEEFRRRAC